MGCHFLVVVFGVACLVVPTPGAALVFAYLYVPACQWVASAVQYVMALLVRTIVFGLFLSPTFPWTLFAGRYRGWIALCVGGGLLYVLAYNVFPYFGPYIHGSYLLGASASVLAIVVATAVREPEYRVNFMFVGAVRLKYVALFMVVTDLLFITSGNGGGHIAHLGGALAGWWFIKSLQKGKDITRWINRIFDWFSGGIKFSRPAKKPKMKVNRGGKADDYDYNARKKQQSEEIDRILDKLKQSGYGSLTTEEKKRLFDASKK